MPLRLGTSFGKFSNYPLLITRPSDAAPLEFQSKFDWGFDIELPWTRLSVFARDIDSAAPVSRMPVYAQATFALTSASVNALDDAEAVSRLAFAEVPLGVIGTDHVGYGSFDLWPLRSATTLQSLQTALQEAGLIEAGRPRLTISLSRLLVFPYKDPSIAFDALAEGDRGPDFIVLRVELDSVMRDGRLVWPSMPAMQTPGIGDWRLSPGSFSMSGALLIGEDGCETLLPANLATRLIRFRQFVRSTSKATAIDNLQRLSRSERTGLRFTGATRLGYAITYHSEWFPIGHSLGQITYSLPLAPGEKMRIAVVDWSRHDSAKRTEQTTEKEDLQHAAVRDRTLTEAVQMVVKETQSGSSFMAGGALSAGAGIPIGPVSLGVGGAFGLGGASSDSEGMRSVVGDTTQKISDAFHQASSAQRELNSTVVVQADQVEEGEARTRTVANYNHSHALTILYYEVLHHNRVLTRPVSIRPVLFLEHDIGDFASRGQDGEWDVSLIELHAQTIAANLLDESLRDCLAVVKKFACLQRNFKGPATHLPTDDFVLSHFLLKTKTGASVPTSSITPYLVLKDGPNVKCFVVVNQSPPIFEPVLHDYFDKGFKGLHANAEDWFHVVLERPVRWGNLSKLVLWQGHDGQNSSWDIEHVHVCANAEPLYWVMAEGPPPFSPLVGGGMQIEIPLSRYIPGPHRVGDMLSGEERCCLERFANHINAHRAHYLRAVLLVETAADRAARLDNWKIGAETLLDVTENTLLDVSDGCAILPIVPGADKALDPAFATQTLGLANASFGEFIEQILTFPARGVFAEAKLGHCNASELIDPDRFWDWQRSPIPDDAPEIEAVSMDSRHQDPTKALAPTPFPSGLVNIVNPQALPDPKGLSSAADVISALGAFRDMSGMRGLTEFMKTLSDNASALAALGLGNAQPQQPAQHQPGGHQPGAQQSGGQQPGGQQAGGQQPGGQQTGGQQPRSEPIPDSKQVGPTGRPRPSDSQKPKVLGPKTRRLLFTFMFDTETEMWGEYQIELQDIQTMHTYIPDGDIRYAHMVYMDVPSSITGGVVVRITGTVRPQKISAASDIEPRSWSLEIQKTEQFPTLEKVSGFNVVATTKDVALKLTLETENQHTDVDTDTHEFGVTMKAGGTVKVVEIEGEGAYKYITNSSATELVGNKEVTVKELTVKMLDKQKQPKIIAVK
jgi:hypothetical protein